MYCTETYTKQKKTNPSTYKLCFLRLYLKFQGSGKKFDNCDGLHPPVTPVTPEGGWDKCRINFNTLETSDTILKKTVYTVCYHCHSHSLCGCYFI